MPGSLFEALGAALQTGGRTYGALTEDERQRKLQEAELARRAEQDRLDNEARQQQLAGQDKDRQFRILDAAITGLAPNAEASPELFAKAREFGQEGRFNVEKGGSSTPGVSGLPFGLGSMGGILPQDRVTRNPTLQESQLLTEARNNQEDRDNVNAFRTHITSDEHGQEDFDTQTREAFAHGINNMPMGSKEFDRRQGIETQNAIRVALAKAKGAGVSNIEGLADAVISNPQLYQQLTPTARTKLAPALNARGFNFETPMAENAKKYLAEGESAVNTANQLESFLGTPEGQKGMGPLKGYAGMLPDTDLMQTLFGTRDVKASKANIALVRQRIGKLLEGGVLRLEDERKYAAILPTEFDPPETAQLKMTNVINTLNQDVNNFLKQQQTAGKKTSATVDLNKSANGAPGYQPPAGGQGKLRVGKYDVEIEQ